MPLAVGSDVGGIAPHIVGVFLAVLSLVAGSRPVGLLLLLIEPPEVIRMPATPRLIVAPLVLLAAGWLTTGLLAVLEARMGSEPASTIGAVIRNNSIQVSFKAPDLDKSRCRLARSV